ncbi:MAG: hypothetical protein JWM10_2999 [Myxococcaceae bacterium]|nr:hypothetical protein [Myxococcaceae bacterium]
MAYRKSGRTELRAASLALTTSLVATDPLAVVADSTVTLETLYAVGTGGTGVEVYPEASIDDGATWDPAVTALDPGTPSGGAVTLGLAAATYAQTGAGRRLWSFDVPGATHVRVSVKETGAVTVAGTCRVRAVTSRQEG